MVNRALKITAIGVCCCSIVLLVIRIKGGPITDGWQLCVSGPRRAVRAGEPVLLDISVRNFSWHGRMIYGREGETRYGLFASFKDQKTGTRRVWQTPQSHEWEPYLPASMFRGQRPWTAWPDWYCVSNVLDTSRPGRYVLQLKTGVSLGREDDFRNIELRSNPVIVTVIDDGLSLVRRDMSRSQGAGRPADSVEGNITVTTETEQYSDDMTPERVELLVGWTNRAPMAQSFELARDPLDDLEIKVLGVSPYLAGVAPYGSENWGSGKSFTHAEMDADDRLGVPTFQRCPNGLIGAPERSPLGDPVNVCLDAGEIVRYRVPLSRLFDLTAVGTYLVSVRPRWATGNKSGETTNAPAFGTLETHVVIRHGRPWEMSFGPVWHG